MKASLIISVYKNIPFLKAVLDSFRFQTEKDVEIIIAEDGENESMRQFVSGYPFECPYTHITQKDDGWRKNRCLNEAIKASNADHLIFIDGDCVMHERFLEMHLRFSADDVILAGKRVKLNEKYSNWLINDTNNVGKIQSRLRRKLISRKKGLEFVEEGLFISPDGLLGFIPGIRQNNRLVGCNMSFSKKAVWAVNGFDEDYILPAVGEDADLSWRFSSAGYKHFSLRNMAVVYHLHHPLGWSDQGINLEIYREKRARNEFVCLNGLRKPGEIAQ